MTQEGKDLEQMAASVAEGLTMVARGLQQTTRGILELATTFEAWRGHMAVRREQVQAMADAASAEELADAVYPEGRRARERKARPAPPPEASGDLAVPVPWATFYETHGILGPQAVSIIRSRFPAALVPGEDEPEEERSAWPEPGTPEEVAAAVDRLENLDDQRAIAAQAMILEVMAGEEGSG
jgi:hypothetical protein